MRFGISMQDINLLQPGAESLTRQRRWGLITAVGLAVVGGATQMHLWLQHEELRQQQQRLESTRLARQQQLQLQQRASQQRRTIVAQQRRVVEVLRGLGLSKSAQGHYTKIDMLQDGWRLHGVAASHADVGLVVSTLQRHLSDLRVIAEKIVVQDSITPADQPHAGVRYELRLRAPTKDPSTESM